MPATPKRAGRTPKAGSHFLSEVLGENVRITRSVRRLNQEDLAERMRALGHEKWVRATVSEVERAGRAVSVDELVGLALSLNASVAVLLDPGALRATGGNAQVDLGLAHPIPSALLRGMVAGQNEPVVRWENNQPILEHIEGGWIE